MKYRLAGGIRLVPGDDGGLLVRHYPLHVIRCNASLWGLLHRPDTDGLIDSSAPVLEKLARAGLLERVWEKPEWPDCPKVSVIVPVKDRQAELKRCLDSLLEIDYPAEKLQVIVVDDGSVDDSAGVARQAGARCISSGGTGRGPAAARNKGAAVARGELLAFVDSDCTVSRGWLRELVAPFRAPDTAAAGGRVRGYSTLSRLDRYEDAMSSLALGSKEQWAGPGNDSLYLPSCNLLVRKEFFLDLQGFDESMHVGEDVDLSYRLRDGGYRIGYIPTGDVYHAHRNRIPSFMSRRFAYGTSEALLQKKHTSRRKKMSMSLFSLAQFLLLPGLFVAPPVVALLILLLFSIDVSRQVLGMRDFKGELPLTGILLARCRTFFSLGYYVSYHCVRYYLPLLLGLSIFNSAVAAVTTALFLWASLVDYLVKGARLDFPSFLFIYLLEQTAYSCGVFRGCLKQGSFSTYRVSLRFSV